jgi:hypothetical protein
VNTADPCVRGSTPTSIQIGRTSSKARPSRRTVEADAALEDLFAQNALLQFLENLLRFHLPLDLALG